MKKIVLEKLAGSADELIVGFFVVNGFEDFLLLDPLNELFF